MPILHTVRIACATLMVVAAQPVWAQQPPQPPGDPQHGRPPPPNAYTDCKGRKAGDVVQHTNPRGTGPATCMDSPEGLVARPNPPPGAPPSPPPGDRPPPERR